MSESIGPRRVILRSNRDSQISLTVGPFKLAVRSILCIGALTPLYFAAFALPGGSLVQLGGFVMLIVIAYIVSLPMQEDVWIGTFLFYRFIDPMMARAVTHGKPLRAEVKQVGKTAVQVKTLGPPTTNAYLGGTTNLLTIPRSGEVERGLFEVKPGGWRAMMKIQGPSDPPYTKSYQNWQDGVQSWLGQTKMATQIFAPINHYSRSEIEDQFEQGIIASPRTKLMDYERETYGALADTSIVVTHYVVLMPQILGSDGLPVAHNPTTLGAFPTASYMEAKTALADALRLAPVHGVSAVAASKEEIGRTLDRTVVRIDNCSVVDGVVQMGNHYVVYGVLAQLPVSIWNGTVIKAFMRESGQENEGESLRRSQPIQGALSLHILPVSGVGARSILEKSKEFYKYAAERGDDEAARRLDQVVEVIDRIASGVTGVSRVALTLAAEGESRDAALRNFETIATAFAADGLQITRVTLPGMAAAIACSPGGLPLARSLAMVMDDVSAALVPALGTPFSDQTQALIGQDADTGSPAYIDFFGKAMQNHNVLIVGTTGAGKSVACKTLFMRHILRGARGIIIDPDSEYRALVQALNLGQGGDPKEAYVELGERALNPLARPMNTDIEDQTQWMASVIALLSVMAGEEVGYSQETNAPIRKMSDEDKAWLHEEVVNFFRQWQEYYKDAQPILSNLISYLSDVSYEASKKFGRERQANAIILRLTAYTQGEKGAIFNRATDIDWRTPRVLGIGLKNLAMKYDSDMTAALAFALSAVMMQLGDKERIARKERIIVLVDEAHRVASNPDAALVLQRLIRQARKYGGGVWLASQSVEDFMGPGGATLAGLMNSKLVLGVDPSVEDKVQEFFKLSDRERSSISPNFVRGRGVMITNNERAIVRVIPGAVVLKYLMSTTFGE